MQTVLVVDDDPDMQIILSTILRRAGYSTLTASDGTRALAIAASSRPDLVILDINLPGQSGHAVCKQLRDSDPELGILMLSSLGGVEDKVLALELGADNYITKPVSESELLTRLVAIRRRRSDPASETIQVGLLQLEPSSHRAAFDGTELKLTPTEFKLMALFVRQPARIFERETLWQTVQETGSSTSMSTMDIHVRNLRRKIPSTSPCIKPVHGVGYRLDAQSLSFSRLRR